ncbi:MAG: hypothetical protein PHR06_02360 [Candidatus Cloacimonetes bacterium]|nr:hypothetical protein [Candidatus Cloacimonadota bacterium]
MELEQLIGYWILEQREETPIQDNQFTVFDRSYEIIDPHLEILYFKSNENKCFHLGLKLLPLGNREDFDYDITSFLPGTYDHLTKTIAILENGTMSIVNGKLSIKEIANDYKCDEVWTRLTAEHVNLIKFLDFEFKNI